MFTGNSGQTITGSAIGVGGLYAEARGGSTISVRDSSFTQNVASGTAFNRTTALWLDAYDASTVVVGDRLLVDENNPSASHGEDVQLNAFTAASITLRDTQVTRGKNGIVATADGTGTSVRVGQSTIDGYTTGLGVLMQLTSGATMALENSLLADNGTDDNLSAEVTTPGNCIATTDPNFPGFVGGGNYRLLSSSAAIDQGVDNLSSSGALDRDHHARHAGAHPDCGAYEYGSLFGDDFESGDLGPSATVPAVVWSATSP